MGDFFNYQKWSADTRVTLTSVNWNNDYRDTVYFDGGQSALDTWIDEQTHSVDVQKMSLSKFNQRIKIDLPVNLAMQYNYLRASNPVMPLSGDNYTADQQRNYYYFIQAVDYENPRTTILTLQLDVFQTFIYDVQFGNCYIERGHIGIANTRQFEQYGRSYLDAPEGLDIGSEYRVTHTEQIDFNATGEDLNVLVCSMVDLTVDPGIVTAPILKTAPGGLFNGLPTGASFYVFKTAHDFGLFMTAYADKPWITQSIISITLVPLQRFFTTYTFTDNVSPVSGVEFYIAPPMGTTKNISPVKYGWRDDPFITDILGSDYAGLKKFLTYPYMVIELTTWTGSPLILRPEAWQDANATVNELGVFMPPGQRIAAIPNRYNADAETATYGYQDDDNGEFLDMAAFLTNFPTFPLVNDMAINFLASNKNGLNFSYQSADWAQNRAIAGATAGANVSNEQARNTGRQAGIQSTAAVQANQNNVNAAIGQAATSMVSSVAGGEGNGMSGGVASGAAGAMTTAISAGIAMGHGTEATNISNAARASSAISDIQTAAQIRDTNVGYAHMAANGDYGMALAGINAKIQDARMTQPSTAGQFGGDTFNLATGHFGYSLRWKMLSLGSLRRVGNYWLRYGYAIHQFGHMPSNFKCMSRFTYWKLQETYLVRAFIPEMFKQAIRGIFEKGVTIWSAPEDIGTTNLADNLPLPGINY